MIDKKVFANEIQEIALAQGTQANADYMMALYKYISDDFNDNSFKAVCRLIMKNEELYGKMPTPRHFTKYLPKQITDDEAREAKKAAFLEKVSNYLQLDYVMDYDRAKFKDITELESRVLRSNGGLSEMWSRVHNYDYPCKISTIIKELGEFYDNNYTRESVEHRLELTDKRGGGLKQINFLGVLNGLEG